MAEDILGISGQMDISDIQASIDKLCDGLNRVGADTDALSQRMTKALNDIANSNGDLASKTTQAMQTLKSAMDEATKELDAVPSMIDNANKRVETIEGTIDKLNEKLAETEKGSDAFNSITKQIDAQKQSLQLAKEDVVELTRSYENVKNSISEVNGAYQTLNALSIASTTTNGAQSTSNIAVGVSATAAATATTAEAAAHTANSAAALKNAEAENQNVQATQQLTAALQEYISVSSGRAEVERMQAESTKELNADIKMYEESIKEIQTILDTTDFSKKIEEATVKIEEQKAKLEQYKDALANLSKEDNATGNGANYYNKLIDESQQKIEQLQTKVSEWSNEQKRLNADVQEYNTLLEAAKKIQAGEKIADGFKKATEEAKKTSKETEKVGKSADDAAKKVGGIFSKFKNTLGGALKGNFSGLFSIFGKIGVWGAALAAVGKGIYELTIRAEEFRNALQPLSHYLDESNLQAVRQNILALSDETAKSVSDMAAAATQFVKVWDSLRDSPEALTTMIKSSNEFGALSGKTSEEGAKFLSNLASEYHMTAQEATEASAMIATAAHNSTSSFGEMADAISSAGSSAALYGVSFKEMATLIGYSSNQFGGAQKSASKFSMLLMSMSKLQDNYNPSVVGMITALQNLKKAYDNGEHVENNFMARQRSIAMYFIKNADAIAKYNKGIDSNTAKQELLNDINARASVNVAKLQNAWDGFLTAVNANLTPTLTRILNFFAKIIGGAQKTADELNYLKNFDNIHKGAKRGMQYTESVTSGWTAGFQESAVANMGARQQYNLSKEDGLKQYRKQRDRLKRIYQQGLKNAQNTWQNASSNAYAKSAGNFMLQYYNKNRSSFSEFTPQMFNNFLRNQRNSTISLLQKPINSNTNLGGNGYVPKPKKDNSADQQRNYREQLAEQQAKQIADDKKIEWELYVAEQEEGIAKEHDANEKELKQRKLDFEKKKHQIEEEAETLRQKNIQLAKAEYNKNPENKKKEGFYASGLDKQVTLTSDQKALIQAKYNTLNAQEKAYDLQQLKAKTQSLYDYLKEYGTFKEQQLAIAKEYDEKIRAAESQGDTYKVKSLQAEKQKQIGDTKAKDIESRIDYTKVFGDFGIILREQMDDILKSMKAFSKTDTFKAKPINEQKDFLSRMNELSNQYGTSKWKDINFSQLGKLIDDYNQKLKKRNEAEDKLNESSKTLVEAQEAYKKAMESGDTNEKLNAKGKLGNAQIENEDNRKLLEYADANLLESQNNVTDSAQKLSGTLNSLDALLNNMKSGSISNVWNSFVDFDKKVNGGKATQAVTDTIGKVFNKAFAGKSDLISQIIGAVLTLLDTIAEQGIGGIVGGLIDSVLRAINGLLDNLLSGKFLEQIGESLINGIGGIIDNVIGKLGSVLSFGALSSKGPSAWFENSNAEKVEEAINNLTDRNKSLQQSIDDLNDTIKNSSGAKSVEAYKEAYKLQEEQNENYKKIAQEQAGYHGAHGSWNKYWGGFSSEEISRIKEITGRNDFSGNLWDLSPEEMKKLRGGAIDIWERIKNTGKGGYGSRLTDKLDDYIDQAGKLQELTDQINESLTQVSFSSMKDDFVSNLMDMEKNAEDFANDFSEMMQKSVLRYGLENLLNTDLKKLYEKWGAKMQEGNLSKDDIDNLKKEYDDLVKKGIEQRDYWAKITGYTGESSQSQQTATGKGIEAITADQASSLIGIGYAVQSAIEVGNETRKQISVDISSLRIFSEQTANNISEMRDIQYQGLEQLEAINKNTAPIILIREDIASMYKLMKENY